MPLRVVLLADRVPVIRVDVPLQPPAPLDVTVVAPPPEEDGGDERRHERDVGERAADEVVAAVGRPVDDRVQVCNQHRVRLAPSEDGIREREL
jgi:hypothetical protein